jgi:hypothetical protein
MNRISGFISAFSLQNSAFLHSTLNSQLSTITDRRTIGEQLISGLASDIWKMGRVNIEHPTSNAEHRIKGSRSDGLVEVSRVGGRVAAESRPDEGRQEVGGVLHV